MQTDSLKNTAWDFLEERIVKYALLKLGVSLTGVWGSLAVMILEIGLRKFAKPVYLGFIRKGIIKIDSEKLEKLQGDLDNEQSEDEFNSAVDAMY